MIRRSARFAAAVLPMLTWAPATAIAFVEEVPAEIKKSLHSSEPGERRDAARRAAEYGAPAIPLLIPIAGADRDSAVRDSAFLAMTRVKTSDAVTQLVARGLKSSEAASRRIAAEVLAEIEAPGVDAELMPLLSDSNVATRVAGAYACGFVKARSTRKRLVELVDSDPEPLVRSVAAESVGRIGGAGVVELLDRFMRSPREDVQVAALAQYFGNDPVRGAAVTAEVLGRRDLRLDEALRPLLVQAIEEAERYKTKPCLPRLVELLAHPRARARDMAWQALRSITGLDIPNQPSDWMQWWCAHGGGFEIPDSPSSKSQRSRSGTRTQATFYGIPIVSDRVVFVIDYSGSMRETGPDGGTKIDGARVALAEVLNALPDRTEFDLIAFSTVPHLWRQTMQRKEKSTIDAALEFANQTSPDGSTNLYDSLIRAIGQDGADTVIVLTDGAPSSGAYQLFPRILANLRLQNRIRKVAISAIGLNTGGEPNRFLRDLARETGGDFIER